jgi:hypothetical protein
MDEKMQSLVDQRCQFIVKNLAEPSGTGKSKHSSRTHLLSDQVRCSLFDIRYALWIMLWFLLATPSSELP